MPFPIVAPKVFVTRKIPGDAIPRLKRKFQVKVYPYDREITRRELLKGVGWCDALLCLLTDKVDAEVMDAAPHLKVISNYAVGFNNIEVGQATSRGIVVCNTPGPQVSDAVAEHTFALLLGLAKRLHEAEELVRLNRWKGWAPELLLGVQVQGKTLGIIGLGRIGKGVAERAAHGMGMKVLYHDVIRDRGFEKKYGAVFVPLRTLLRRADFVTLHVPLLPATRHLIGKKELRLMKRTAFLINTSRGPVVDEKSLITALERKQIAGAGLDVYERFPSVNPRLRKLPNCLLTPHTGSATVEVRLQMGKDAADSIISVFSGKKPEKIVNPEVWEKRRGK